jgi:predicted transcriptional regulator
MPKRTNGTKATKGTKAKGATASPKRRRARIVAKAEPAAPKRRQVRVVAKAGPLTVTEVAELDDLRKQLQRAAGGQSPLRWNADPDEVRRSVAQLVLTLVEFVRKLLERQSIRRMEAGTLTDRQVEDVGRALMQLEETVRDIAATFGIPPEDLNLDLGPLGKLI